METAMIPIPETKTYRHFFRCRDCLSVFVVEYPSRHSPNLESCLICGGTGFDWMGIGERRVITKPELFCPCDERCTSAVGPKCECRCGGENHGCGLLVRTKIVGDKLQMESLASKSISRSAKAKSQADEYRSALSDAQKRFDAKYSEIISKRNRGEWISNWGDYLESRYASRRLFDIQRMKTHSRRMKSLAEFLSE